MDSSQWRWHLDGSVAGVPFPRTDSSHSFSDGYAERGVGVQNGTPEPDFSDLTIKVSRHEALAQQFRTVRLGPAAASVLVSTASSPKRPGEQLTVLLFLLSLLRSGERAGRLAGRLETSEKANDVQRQMLEATARRPRDRNELADRLRDGQF